MLIALSLLNMMGMSMLIPVMPFVVQQYLPAGGNMALWVGILESINAVCAFLVAPVLGGLSDRIGRRWIIIGSAFGAALGYAVFGIGGALWVLVVGRIVQGLTSGDMPALFAYAADITKPEERAKRFGLLGALFGIGMMVGPGLGGLLAAIDLQAPVFAAAGLSLVAAILGVFLLPESLAAHNRKSSIELSELNVFTAMRSAFKRTDLRGLLIAYVLVTIPFVVFSNNIGVAAYDAVGWSATQVGLLVSVIGVLDIVIQGGLLGLLLPRIGERAVVVSGIVTQAVGCLGIAIVAQGLPVAAVMAAGALIMASGQGFAQATTDALLSTSVSEAEQGWLAGVLQSLATGCQMLAPVLAGLVYSGLGHAVPYWAGLVMILAAALVFARTKTSTPGAPEDAARTSLPVA